MFLYGVLVWRARIARIALVRVHVYSGSKTVSIWGFQFSKIFKNFSISDLTLDKSPSTSTRTRVQAIRAIRVRVRIIRVRVYHTRGSSFGSEPDCHVAHMTRVNRSLVDINFKHSHHATWQKNDTCHHLIGPRGTSCHVSNLAKKYHFPPFLEKSTKPTSYYFSY